MRSWTKTHSGRPGEWQTGESSYSFSSVLSRTANPLYHPRLNLWIFVVKLNGLTDPSRTKPIDRFFLVKVWDCAKFDLSLTLARIRHHPDCAAMQFYWKCVIGRRNNTIGA